MKQTVARVLVTAATAQPPRIHFYRQEDGPFDKVRARLPCPRLGLELGLELRAANTRQAAIPRAYYMHMQAPCTFRAYTMLMPCRLLTTGDPQSDHLVVSQHDPAREGERAEGQSRLRGERAWRACRPEDGPRLSD